MTLAEFHERVCEPPLAQGEEKGRLTAVLLCFDTVRLASCVHKRLPLLARAGCSRCA